MIIHYNPRMFDEAGLDYPDPEWTWDDFLETAKALTSGEGGDKVFGFAIPYFNFGLTPWWHTNETATITEDWSDFQPRRPKDAGIGAVPALFGARARRLTRRLWHQYDRALRVRTCCHERCRSLAIHDLHRQRILRCRHHAVAAQARRHHRLRFRWLGHNQLHAANPDLADRTHQGPYRASRLTSIRCRRRHLATRRANRCHAQQRNSTLSRLARIITSRALTTSNRCRRQPTSRSSRASSCATLATS